MPEPQVLVTEDELDLLRKYRRWQWALLAIASGTAGSATFQTYTQHWTVAGFQWLAAAVFVLKFAYGRRLARDMIQHIRTRPQEELK